MMPDECASMRSMARCVLPVLVGPSTAVTPEPRARASRLEGEEKERDILIGTLSAEIVVSIRYLETPAKCTSNNDGPVAPLAVVIEPRHIC